MDQRSHDILEQCKYVSDAINTYFEDKLYMEGVETPEDISDSLKVYMAIQLVLAELEEMGITTNLDIDDILSYAPHFDTLISIRRKFDKDNFFKLLMEIDEGTYQCLLTFKEDASAAEDIFINYITYFSELYPMDKDWSRLTSPLVLYYYEANSDFADYISDILDKKGFQDINKTYIDDSNFNNVLAFTNNMKERDDRVGIMVRELSEVFPALNRGRLEELVERYDKDKLAPEVLPFFAAYYCMKDKPKEEPAFLANHHKNVYHHLEYWENPVNSNKKITPEQAAMIVASFVLDGYDPKRRLKEVKPFFKYCDDNVKNMLEKFAGFEFSEEQKVKE